MAVIPDIWSSKFAYWDVFIEGEQANESFRRYIQSIAVTYSLNKPTKAVIQFNSRNIIESFLADGVNVEIRFGYSRTSMVTMITGVASQPMQGRAETYLSTTLEVVDNVFGLNKEQKSRVFKDLATKDNIIKQICIMAGYAFFVNIKDGFQKISKDKVPKQIGKTDLHFLYECAERWNCVCWIDGNIVYFMSSEYAHDYGNVNRIPHIQDLKPNYSLKYGTRFGVNNVKNLSWKINTTKSAGVPKSESRNRKGKTISASDYEIPHGDQVWQLRGDILKKMESSFSNAVFYTKMVFKCQVSYQPSLLRKYFVLVEGGSSTNKSASQSKKHKGSRFEVTMALRKGDPYLRVPRAAELECGDGTGVSIELPRFMFRDSALHIQKYNINKVTTTLTSGMLQTRLVMTMGR